MCSEHIYNQDNNCKNLPYSASIIVKDIRRKKEVILDSMDIRYLKEVQR